MIKRLQGTFTAFWRSLHLIEDAALVLLLLVMILLAVSQIVLRNLGDQSLVWADPFLRVSVLWIGLLGASIAARDNSHIAIDIATRYLGGGAARVAGVLLSLFAAVVCGIVGWHAVLFVRDEYEGGAMAFAQVPVWLCEVIMPVAFVLISIRYLIIAFGIATGSRPARREMA